MASSMKGRHLIRARQHVLTGRFPHNGNSKYVIPNRGPKGGSGTLVNPPPTPTPGRADPPADPPVDPGHGDPPPPLDFDI